MSSYFEGKKHDFSIFKKIFKKSHFPDFNVWVDLGFQGIVKFLKNAIIKVPHKKPKNGKLTQEQKEYNCILSRTRVAVEHSIAMLKRYFILRIENRMHCQKKLDESVELCAMLWNFKKNVKT